MKPLPNSFFFISIAIVLSYFSCSNDASSPVENTTSNLVTLEYVVDYENQGNASDLVIKYSVANASTITDLWLFIAPEADFSKLNSNSLADLPSNHYHKISISTSPNEVRPPSSLLDTEGSQISQGIPYRLGFATIMDGTISKEVIVYSFELNDQHFLTGRYVGVWNDETYKDLEITIELRSVGTLLRGPYYYSHNFTPNYGAVDDNGDISFKVDGDRLVDAELSENYPDIMNGCLGKWTGEGRIVDPIIMEISFSGENCLYSTSNAKVVFKRFD